MTSHDFSPCCRCQSGVRKAASFTSLAHVTQPERPRDGSEALPVNRWPSYLSIRTIPSAQVSFLRHRDVTERSMLTNPTDARLYTILQASSCGSIRLDPYAGTTTSRRKMTSRRTTLSSSEGGIWSAVASRTALLPSVSFDYPRSFRLLSRTCCAHRHSFLPLNSIYVKHNFRSSSTKGAS